MKKLLSLFLVSCSLSAFACGGYGDLYPKWSLGVIGYGHLNMPVTGMRSYFLPGIQFTHQDAFGKWAQRVAFEYTNHSVTTPPETIMNGADMLYTSGYEKRAVLRIGLERGWFLHRLFRPYAALDLAGALTKSNIYYSGGIAGFNQRDRIFTKSIGIMPAVGFKTFIGKRISLYAEYRVEGFMNDEDTNITYFNGYTDSRPYGAIKFDFAGGRILQTGVQVMF